MLSCFVGMLDPYFGAVQFRCEVGRVNAYLVADTMLASLSEYGYCKFWISYGLHSY